ncbi:protein BIG GRAIN 1-like A [Andrographis paniculata]|uniref:protein BIG GRAIN 1-like A n=1 Tax=Andrographis paniculata TaxID=175694 RepID=UPI0021E843AD|nr:protein BIG GRAIN 1-like A [Andrographis paniculata]
MVDFQAQQSISCFRSSSNPSFSSSLLDAIYRSIDLGEDEAAAEEEDRNTTKNMKHNYGGRTTDHEEMANFRRACMIEKWMEKKVSEKVDVRNRKNAAAADNLETDKFWRKELNSSSSSSDSSGSGGYGFFSSSDAESAFPAAVQRPKLVRTGVFAVEKEVQRPKPVRTGGSGAGKERGGGNLESNCRRYGGEGTEKNIPAGGGSFMKTKSRALKLYSDLKKVKQQPVSPGGRLAGFLNSLFAGGNNPAKHNKSPDSSSAAKSANASTCSSASSFSRSCLSKTPSSSRGKSKSSTAGKRSVRFSPVSVIVDDSDDSRRPCERNQTLNFNLPTTTTTAAAMIREELMAEAMKKSRRVEAAARDLLRSYHRKNQFEYEIDRVRKPQTTNHIFHGDDDEAEEDDAGSCGSSDLFELENLSGIGMEELPVYETTRPIWEGMVE